MQKSIWQPKLSEILPSSLSADKKIKAIAEALDFELEKLSNEILKVLHLPRLDFLSNEVLDHLATAYHVDNYSADFDLNIKRNMIRKSIYLHRLKGTPAAVELAIAPFTEGGTVQEWFDYGGREFFFRIAANSISDLGDNGEKFLQIIFDSKNVRSWLEEIFIDLTREILDDHKIYLGTAEQNGGQVSFDIDSKIPETKDKLYVSTAEQNAGQRTFDVDSSFDFDDKHKVILSFDEQGGGQINFDIDSAFDFADKHKIIPQINEQNGGEICFDIDKKLDYTDINKLRSAIIEVSSGIVYYDCDFQGYAAEDFDLDSDHLRLTFDFPSSERVLTLPRPRLDIKPTEILNLSELAAAGKILVNLKNETPTCINRAILITERKEVLL